MNLHDITNKILTKINRADSLGKDFNISCDFVSKEFNQIELESVNRKNESYTVLVLPRQLDQVEAKVSWKEKLFGNNLKGGEK